MTDQPQEELGREVQAPEAEKRTTIKPLRRRWVGVLVGIPVILLLIWGGYHMLRSQVWRVCRKAQIEARWVDLETWSRRWSQWEPSEPDAWLFLADAVQHQNRFAEAAEYLDEITLDSPKAPAALASEAQLLFGAANRPLEGEIACRKLLQVEPRASIAHSLLIRFYAFTLQRKKLEEQVRAAILVEQEPRDAYIYYFLADSLNMAGGEQLNTLWLTSYPDEELFLVARALQAVKKESTEVEQTESLNGETLSEREQQIKKLLVRFPHNINLLADQIEAEVVKGRLDQVISLLKNAPASAETDNRFWRFKGWVHYAKGEFSEAEAAYRKALTLQPMDWQTLNRLTEVLRARQETQEIEHIQDIVKRIQELRAQIRKVEVIEKVPVNVLQPLGILARDCGDELIAGPLERRVGLLSGDKQR